MDSLGLSMFGSSLAGARCVHVASAKSTGSSRQLVLNAPISGWDVALCTADANLLNADTKYVATTASSGTIYVNANYTIVSTSSAITYKLATDGSMADTVLFYAAFFKYN